METDAASQHCCVLLANNVASVCMGLSANIDVAPCKRTQYLGPNNVACSWPTMLCPFAWALKFQLHEPARHWHLQLVDSQLSLSGLCSHYQVVTPCIARQITPLSCCAWLDILNSELLLSQSNCIFCSCYCTELRVSARNYTFNFCT